VLGPQDPSASPQEVSTNSTLHGLSARRRLTRTPRAVRPPVHSRTSRGLKAWLVAGLAVALVSGGCNGKPTASGKAQPSSSATKNSPMQMTTWLAGLLDIASPKWIDGVLSGPPCAGSHNAFCPLNIATTPDGKILALEEFSGEIKVFQVTSHRLLLHEPPAITGSQIVGRAGVWLSSNGRFVARGVSTEDAQGNESTTSFQMWDTTTGRLVLTEVPTPGSPLPPIAAAGIAPDGQILLALETTSARITDWYLLSPARKQHLVVASYTSYNETPATIIYDSRTGSWIIDVGNGYATWSPPAMPSVTVLPCNTGMSASALDGNGPLYACAFGGSHADGSDTMLVWDITKKALVAKFVDHSRAGSVMGATFFDNGRYLAVFADLTHEAYDSTPKNLFTYSVSTRPTEVSVTRLPGVSAGWALQSAGNVAFAMGISVRGGYCCLKAVAGQS
jgi:WD40 repeat protein